MSLRDAKAVAASHSEAEGIEGFFFGRWRSASKNEDQKESVVMSCPFSGKPREKGQDVTTLSFWSSFFDALHHMWTISWLFCALICYAEP